MKKIGIIGGIGATAGARLLDLLFKAYQKNGASVDSDFPEVFLHSLSMTGMDETGIADYDIVEENLIASVELLNHAGAEVIMVACNTVHLMRKVLQSYSAATILNMIDAAVCSVGSAKKVGVISSASTKQSKLYQNALEVLGIEVFQTTESQQKTVDGIIAKVIAGKSGTAEQLLLASIADSMRKNGAEQIILGCTELPLVGIPANRYIDPSVEIIKKVME
jgi:aspartate racemase